MQNTDPFVVREGEKKDLQSVLELIKGLALFEKAPQEVTVTLAEMEQDGFGPNAIFDFIVAEKDGEIIGFALFYEKYSTWKGRCLFLEDFFVLDEYRRLGVGAALFLRVKEIAKERGSRRMEWQVLDWNEVGLNFYKKHGAGLDETWINGKFTYEELQSQGNGSL